MKGMSSATLQQPQPPYGVPLPRAGMSLAEISDAEPAVDLDAVEQARTRPPSAGTQAPADWQTTWKNHWLCLHWKKPKANFKGFI